MKLFTAFLLFTVYHARANTNDFKNPEISLIFCSHGEKSILAKRFEWTDWKKEPVHIELKHDSITLKLTLTTLDDGLSFEVAGRGGMRLATDWRGGGFSDFRIWYVSKKLSNNEAFQECSKHPLFL